MQLILMTMVVMTAFASNSLLTRAALADNLISPGSFAIIRVISGALILFFLVYRQNKSAFQISMPDYLAVFGLSAYLLGFSFAYVSMDAGIGALILFGGVQLTMFSAAVKEGEKIALNRWAGALLSLGGLFYLLAPSEQVSISVLAFLLMSIAAFGWGLYSLIGRKASNPLAATAWNFIWSIPPVAFFWLLFETDYVFGLKGVVLAVISGAVTSGLGYAAWYSILPKLGASRAAISQLSVPIIAILLGALFLSEAITTKAIISSVLVIGGIIIGMMSFARR